MASVFTHAAFACALAYSARPVGPPLRFYALAAFCSIAPDFDVIGFHLGIEYEDMLGHRGLSHSLAVAVVAGVVLAVTAFRGPNISNAERVRAALALTLATASHGLLDALTNGGLGIAFFSPFDTARYFLPWTPIEVSPIGIAAFFSEWGLAVLASEFTVVWLPCAVFCALLAFARSRRRAAGAP